MFSYLCRARSIPQCWFVVMNKFSVRSLFQLRITEFEVLAIFQWQITNVGYVYYDFMGRDIISDLIS